MQSIKECAIWWWHVASQCLPDTFYLTQTIAACNCTGLFTNLKLIIQFTSILTIYLQSNAIHTGDYSVGSDVVASKGVKHCSREDRVCLVCMPSSVEDEHHFLFDCPAHSHIRQQYSHLKAFSLGSILTGSLFGQPNVLGSHLKTCFAQIQSVLASPRVVWLLKFVELD